MSKTLGSNFVKTVIQNLTTNIVILGLGFATSVLLARMLGPEGRGLLEAIKLWPMLLIVLSMFGLGKAVSYFSAQSPQQAASYFATGWVLLVVFAIPIMMLGWFIIPLTLRDYGEVTIQAARIFLLLIPIQFAGNLPFWSLHGLGKFSIWNVLRSLFGVLWLLVVLTAFITDHKTAFFMASGYLIAMIINCAIWMYFMFRVVPGPYKPQLSHLSKLIRYALPSTFMFLPQQLNQRLDQMLIAVFLPAEILGLYVVAVAWSNLLSLTMTPISQAVFPKVAGMTDSKIAEDYGIQALRMSMLIAFALFLMMLFVTPFIFPMIYGGDFKSAVPAAILLVAASAIKSVGTVNAEILSGLGKPKEPMKAQFIGLAGTFLALLFLLRPYGLMGAAIASFIGYGITVVSSLIFLLRETNTSLRYLFPMKEDILILIAVLYSNLTRLAKQVSIDSRGAM